MALPALAVFHIRYMLQASVVIFDLPTRLGKLQPSQFIHRRIVSSPVLRRTVLGNDPKHLNHAIVLKMDYCACCRDVIISNRPIASPVRVDPSVVFAPCQPSPSNCIDLSKIHQAAVPAVKKQVFRLESARLGRVDQVPEMVILGLAIIRLVIDPVIAWQVALAIGPKQRQQVDPFDNSLCLPDHM